MDAEQRARLEEAAEHHWPSVDPGGVRVMVGLADLRALLDAFDAQAIRLARIAEICRMGIEGKDALEERNIVQAIALGEADV